MKANVHFFYHISLNYSYNETQFRQFCREIQNTHFTFSNFSPANLAFMR